MLRCSEELERLDRAKLHDPVMRRLLKMGTVDWKDEDFQGNQTTPAMRHATAMASRLLAHVMKEEDQVRPSVRSG